MCMVVLQAEWRRAHRWQRPRYSVGPDSAGRTGTSGARRLSWIHYVKTLCWPDTCAIRASASLISSKEEQHADYSLKPCRSRGWWRSSTRRARLGGIPLFQGLVMVCKKTQRKLELPGC